jgi:hypothetical protein
MGVKGAKILTPSMSGEEVRFAHKQDIISIIVALHTSSKAIQ